MTPIQAARWTRGVCEPAGRDALTICWTMRLGKFPMALLVHVSNNTYDASILAPPSHKSGKVGRLIVHGASLEEAIDETEQAARDMGWPVPADYDKAVGPGAAGIAAMQNPHSKGIANATGPHA